MLQKINVCSTKFSPRAKHVCSIDQWTTHATGCAEENWEGWDQCEDLEKPGCVALRSPCSP